MSTAKQKFIQQTAAIFIASHRLQPDTDKAIDWAEALWKKLSERGYGSNQAIIKKPRKSVDQYKELSPTQKKWFCLFWTKFNYKHARNDAAKAWGQLGELTDDEYEKIAVAATHEAHRQLPSGQSRKLAGGWLRELRFNDNADPSKKPTATKEDASIIETQQDLAHARTMYKQTNIEEWNAEVQRLESKLNALRK